MSSMLVQSGSRVGTLCYVRLLKVTLRSPQQHLVTGRCSRKLSVSVSLSEVCLVTEESLFQTHVCSSLNRHVLWTGTKSFRHLAELDKRNCLNVTWKRCIGISSFIEKDAVRFVEPEETSKTSSSASGDVSPAGRSPGDGSSAPGSESSRQPETLESSQMQETPLKPEGEIDLSSFVVPDPPELAEAVTSIGPVDEALLTATDVGLTWWCPTGWAFNILETFHSAMPWWASIVAITVIFRIAIFPFIIISQSKCQFSWIVPLHLY